jgi:hypothetical protein
MNDTISFYVEKYGSDKVRSGYAPLYDQLLRSRQKTVQSLLEIGIGTLQPEIPSTFVGNTGLYPHYKPGGSLRAWRDYFQNAQIYGVDVAEDCRMKEERLETFIFSSVDTVKCNQYFQDESLDIIIDDGLHTGIGQLYTMYNFFRKVKPDGLYIIEDCGGGGDGTNIFEEFEKNFKNIADAHEYFFGGNFIVIIKNNSGKGQVHSFEELCSTLHIETKPPVNLTLVSGLWNIQREGRSFDHYIENFKKFLDIPVNMFLYLPKDLEYLVWQNSNRNKTNTHVKIFELEDIKNLYGPFWDSTQAIRTNPSWYNQTGETGWLVNSPQAVNEWYNPIVQSKMFMLHDAKLMNVFNNDYFIWLDAGITNTVYEKFFTENHCLDKIIDHLDTFLFLSYPYQTQTEIHGFDFSAMNRYARTRVNYVCRGGLFGGHKDVLSEANAVYYTLLKDSLDNGYMGTEESIFSIMSHLEPNIYRRYALSDNGLIVKFIQDLINDSVALEPIDNTKKIISHNRYNKQDKTSLYVLGFNFPEQFETLLKSFELHPDFINRPRKILINNSTDSSTFARYDFLCKHYGFEHIQTGTNLGINRGRHYAAKHFHESDSQYYYFFEDDMCLHEPITGNTCRNGFKTYIPNLYDLTHEIVAKESLDFLKVSYTEVYMDNNIQVSWYNVPQSIRTELWPDYDQLPITGLDPNAPRTKFNRIEVHGGISYAVGDVYYANWPMLVSKTGNYKMFLETPWENPYEQTWMSYMFQRTLRGELTPAVLLASPINHNRISHYSPDVRREN